MGLIREGALSTPTIQRQLLLTPTPQYGQSSRDGYLGSSRYHGLTFRAEKRFGAGGMVGGHYTYSKNMTNVETLTGWLEGGAGTPAAGYQTNDLDGEWSLSSFDIRHRVVLNFVYDLPFGEGRRFGTGATGIAEQADQWLDPEWRDDDSEWIAARIHRHAESDWIGLRLAAEYGSKLRQERRRGGARPA